MKMIQNKILKILLLIIIFISSQNAFANEKLIFSVDIIRHGDRNPTSQLPKSYLSLQGGLGELTKKGNLQEKKLGEVLRKKYIYEYHLLPEIYDSNSMYVRSTDTARTIKSANSLLLGLISTEF